MIRKIEKVTNALSVCNVCPHYEVTGRYITPSDFTLGCALGSACLPGVLETICIIYRTLYNMQKCTTRTVEEHEHVY